MVFAREDLLDSVGLVEVVGERNLSCRRPTLLLQAKAATLVDVNEVLNEERIDLGEAQATCLCLLAGDTFLGPALWWLMVFGLRLASGD